jgi:uncharacterized protein Usg
LFFETAQTKEAKPLYTLKTFDHTHNGVTYISLYKAYLELDDPTEYEFAVKYFESWEHWMEVAQSPRLSAFVEEWRKELHQRLKSIALANVRQMAQDETHKASFSANKFLLEKGWEPKEKKAVGRPSKEEAVEALEDDLFNEDYERLLKKLDTDDQTKAN